VNDQKIERVIGVLLQAGVLLSALVVAAGGAWLLARQAGTPAAYAKFRPGPPALRSPGGVAASLEHRQPAALVQFGLLLLIATPVLRVVFSLAAFAWQRDWPYVAITLLVLAVLAYSLAVPHGAG